MNQILQDPYLYELVKDIQKQCSFSIRSTCTRNRLYKAQKINDTRGFYGFL